MCRDGDLAYAIFHLGEPFRQHDILEIISLTLFLHVEMRYELILKSLAAFDVCFMIRDIANELVPDFCVMYDEFPWLFCCAIICLCRFTVS